MAKKDETPVYNDEDFVLCFITAHPFLNWLQEIGKS